jgi:hypothetical protein
MKKALLALAAIAMAGSALAQGTIKIENNNTIKTDGSGTYRIPIWVDLNKDGVQQTATEVGIGTYAQANTLGGATLGLFTAGSSTPFAQALFRTDANGAFLGTVTGPGTVAAGTTVTVPGALPGTRPTLTARAWTGGSFAAAQATPGAVSGEWTFQVGRPLGGDPGGGATPILPSGLAGLGDEATSAGLGAFVTPVPEPSTIALGVLGVGALVLARRRK